MGGLGDVEGPNPGDRLFPELRGACGDREREAFGLFWASLVTTSEQKTGELHVIMDSSQF